MCLMLTTAMLCYAKPYITAGSRNVGIPSFANVISRAKAVEHVDAPKMNEMGKKGKKSSRVLLSTSGGRRY